MMDIIEVNAHMKIDDTLDLVLKNQPGPPDPQTNRLLHTKGVDFYLWSVEICSSILIILYIFIFVKVYKGTRYPFILFLIVLFITSNVCLGLQAYFRH